MSNSSIWPIGRTLSGATTPGQSWPGSNGSEGVLHIPKSSSITGSSPSNYLVSYLRHSLRESYSSAEMQSVYSTAPVDWARHWKGIPHYPKFQNGCLTIRCSSVSYPGHLLKGRFLCLCRNAVSIVYSPSRFNCF